MSTVVSDRMRRRSSSSRRPPVRRPYTVVRSAPYGRVARTWSLPRTLSAPFWPQRRQALRPFLRPRAAVIIRGVKPRVTRPRIPVPRVGAFARPSLLAHDVCVSKQRRREVLFARGVGGSKWRNRIDMRNAYHDGKRC